MKRTAFFLLLLLGSLAPAAVAQDTEASAEPGPPAIEMTTYYLTLIKRGPQWTAEQTPEVAEILKGHFANMEKLATEGKLILAGPFLDQPLEQGTLTGLFLLKAGSLEEAQALADSDPGAIAGRFTMDVYPWYGPVGITYTGAPTP